jgi:2-methylisocitrate lyase-like PEP mutase family enzyme
MTVMSDQAGKATKLRVLHHGPSILVLPNAWDCASARVFEDAGFPAIATTSAGVAFSLGYPDGQHIRAEEMLIAVKRIADCVDVPVTADLESCYDDPAATTGAVVEAGAVGLNVEDLNGSSQGELVEVETQVRKIRTIRRVGSEMGVPLVINARTDVYLAGIGEAVRRFDLALERLQAYIEAGADCVFVPGIQDESLIREFVDALRFPLNILIGVGTPPLARLQEIGVARVSTGSGIARATIGLTRRIAREIKATGSLASLFEGAISYADANALFRSE